MPRQIDFLQRRIAALEGKRTAASRSKSLHDVPFLNSNLTTESIQEPEPVSALYLSPGASDIATQSLISTSTDQNPAPQVNHSDLNKQNLEPPATNQLVRHSHPDKCLPNVTKENVVTDRVDGMGTVSSESANSSKFLADRLQYFGNSSTIIFVSKIRSILADSKFKLWRENPHPSKYTDQLSQPPFTEDYAIPTRLESDAMLAFFWSQIYPICPFLDRHEFETAYDKLWSSDCENQTHSSLASSHRNAPDISVRYVEHQEPNDGNAIPESRSFHILLNAIYALVCAWNTPNLASIQSKRAEVYRRRLEDLFERDIHVFSQPRLTFIQALLYLSLYLQSMSTAELTTMCWNIIGVATRMSQALGLHRLSGNATECSTDGPNHSTRWRTWAGCVLMEW